MTTSGTSTTKLLLLDWLAAQAEHGDLTGLGNKKVRWLFRAVHPDLRSREGFRYPWPGQWAKAPGPILKHTGSCPRQAGDGLCVAKTFKGAGMGGIRFGTFLLVGITSRDVLGEDDHKVRVRKMYVADVLALQTILGGANLRSAHLGSANLGSADLGGADLRSAYLGGAILRGADLGGADLRSAYLGSAYLGGAILRGADLGSADLRSAYLRGADLRGANLRGANLRSADLGGADLGSANYSQLTIWPTAFDPVVAGAVLR